MIPFACPTPTALCPPVNMALSYWLEGRAADADLNRVQRATDITLFEWQFACYDTPIAQAN